MTDSRTLTHADFLALLRERFGPSPATWAFVCPSCGDVATGADFRDALADHPFRDARTHRDLTASDVLGQYCIGRFLGALDRATTIDAYRADPATRGCDWVAFGLFRGPWTVTTDDGKTVYSFAPADVPAAAP